MGTVGEARIVVSATDRTGEAFASIARKVEQLGRTTKRVGEAAASIGKVAGEVDRISTSVGRADAAVARMSGALRSMDEGAVAIGRVAAAVDRAAATMPRLTADAAAMAKAMQGVTAAETALAAETDRVARAGAKLTLFKDLAGDLKGARATMAQAERDLGTFTRAIEERDARIAQHRASWGAAVEAQNAASRAVVDGPSRADAADKALFDAKAEARKASLDAYNSAVGARKDAEKALAEAMNPRQGEKLLRQQADAAKAADLSRAAYDLQRGAARGLKAEIEALAGPMLSVSAVERRLVADAEAATRAFEAEGAAAARAGEAAVRSMTREEEARARQLASTERWMRQYRDLEARAGRQAGALAPRAGSTAVEALEAARRRPHGAEPSSAAAREASRVAQAQLDLAAFREIQATTAELRRAAREAEAEALRAGRDVKAARDPSPALLADHAQAAEAASSANAAFERQAGVLKGLKADIEGVIGPMHSLASAEAQMASRASAADAALKRQEGRHRRLHALHQVADDVLPFEGPEVLHLTREAYQEGAQVQHERVGLQNAGRTPEEIEAIERRSREVSAVLPTATAEENLKIVAETTSAFGSLDHALEHLEFMQRTMGILHTAAGDKMHEGPGEVGRYLAKFFEDRQTKPEDFERQARSLIPAMVATGGVFNPREMFMFAMQARSSLPAYDDEFLSRYMPALIARSTGEQTGTAANAFSNTITGKARDAKQAAAWLNLGLLDPKKLTPGSKGPVGWSAGAVKNTDLALANPVRWSEEVLIPAMKAHGIDTNDRMEVMKQLATMFRNNTANFFANEIAQAVSLALLHKDAGLYDKVGSDKDIADRNLHEDPTVALGALGEAIKTFAANVTSPVMKDVANALGTASQGIAGLGKAVSDFDAAHPDLAKAIGGAALGTGLGVGGYLTTKLFTNLGSLFSGGASAEALTGSAAALTGSAEALTAAAATLRGGAAASATGGMGAGGGAAREAEKDAAKAAPSAFRKAASGIGLLGPLGATFGFVADAMLNRDQSKSLVDGGRPDVAPQDNNLGLPGLDNDPDFAPPARLHAGWWRLIRSRFGHPEHPPEPGLPTPPMPPPPSPDMAPTRLRLPARPVDLTPRAAPAMPAILPVPVAALPARALPPVAAVTGPPVPVHIVSTAANIPAGPLGPGLHRDFTLGNLSGGFASPGLGAGAGFQPFPGHRAPSAEAVKAHAEPLDLAPHVDLSGLDSVAAKVGEAKGSLAELSAMVVNPQVSFAQLDALIAKANAAKAALAGIGGAAGSGTTGSVGPSRVVAEPGVGRTR